ncbi:MAG: carboxylesterase/lipase family protein [Alphaproteobacteria bacterium]
MKRLAPLALALAAALAAPLTPVCADDHGVPLNTPLGTIIGAKTDDEEIVTFNGLPFAAPPVGPLRWTAPQPAAALESPFDATAFGAQCPQSRGSNAYGQLMAQRVGLTEAERKALAEAAKTATPLEESEDCLTLNIRTGNAGGEPLQPVMVWIHGGAHQNGTGANPLYQSNTLVKQGVVLVTVNYRLGALGYMAHPALSAENPDKASGNYGLMDQIAALEWIRDNIAAFGGDPDNVLIFGESAGAQSVTELMAAPASHGLYDKAILQSGVSSGNIRHLKISRLGVRSGEAIGTEFMAPLVDGEATPEALRAVSVDALLDRAAERRDLSRTFLPVIDGAVLPRAIGLAIRDGETPDIAILGGFNADEGSLLYPFIGTPTRFRQPFPTNQADRLAALRDLYGDAGGTRLAALYGMDDPTSFVRGSVDMIGDDVFGVPTRFLAREHVAEGRAFYGYFFTRVPPRKGQTAGAFHASEIPFVFDTHGGVFVADDKDRALTDVMGRFWTQFAKTGNPNIDGLMTWPAYDPAKDEWLNLDRRITVLSRVRKEKFDIQEKALRDILEDVDRIDGR